MKGDQTVQPVLFAAPYQESRVVWKPSSLQVDESVDECYDIAMGGR